MINSTVERFNEASWGLDENTWKTDLYYSVNFCFLCFFFPKRTFMYIFRLRIQTRTFKNHFFVGLRKQVLAPKLLTTIEFHRLSTRKERNKLLFFNKKSKKPPKKIVL